MCVLDDGLVSSILHEHRTSQLSSYPPFYRLRPLLHFFPPFLLRLSPLPLSPFPPFSLFPVPPLLAVLPLLISLINLSHSSLNFLSFPSIPAPNHRCLPLPRTSVLFRLTLTPLLPAFLSPLPRLFFLCRPLSPCPLSPPSLPPSPLL